MTGSKQQKLETETKALSEESLSQVTGGCFPPIGTSAAQQRAIIAIKPQQVMGDGSVKPA